MISSVSLKFARALADVARQEKTQDRVLSELEAFARLLEQHGGLRQALENPVVPLSSRRAVVEEVGRRAGFSGTVVNFILVLLERARIHQFKSMVEAYQAVLDEEQGVVRARVLTSGKLARGLRARIVDSIARSTGRQVRVEYAEEPSLMGGMKIEVGSTIVDGSLRTQLEQLRRRLAGA